MPQRNHQYHHPNRRNQAPEPAPATWHRQIPWVSIVTAILIGLVIMEVAGAKTIYVDDVNGLDTYDGLSWAKAWKTIPYIGTSHGGTTMAEGDTVYVKNGSYAAFSRITGGAGDIQYRSSWTTWQAAAGHTPTIASLSLNQDDKWPSEPAYWDPSNEADVWTAGTNVSIDDASGYVTFTVDSNISAGAVMGYKNYSATSFGNTDDQLGFRYHCSSAIAADTIELVVSESANGAKSGTWVSIHNDTVAASTWAPSNYYNYAKWLGECYRDPNMQLMDAAVSTALYAAADIDAGTVIMIKDIGLTGHGHLKYKFKGFNLHGGAEIAICHEVHIEDCNCYIAWQSVPEGKRTEYVKVGSTSVGINYATDVNIINCLCGHGENGMHVAADRTTSMRIQVIDCDIHSVGDNVLQFSAADSIISGCEIYDADPNRGRERIDGTQTGEFNVGDVIELYNNTTPTGHRGVVESVYSSVRLYAWVYDDNSIEQLWKAGVDGSQGDRIVNLDANGTIEDITGMDNYHTDGVTLSGYPVFDGVEFCYNYVHRDWGGGENGQVIKVDKPGNVYMHDNIVTGSQPMYFGSFYGTNNRINHNTFIGNSEWRIGKHELTEVYIAEFCNNLVSFWSTVVDVGYEGSRVYITKHEGNIYGESVKTMPSQVTLLPLSETEDADYTSAEFAALFTNPAAHNYTIPPDSNAIDFGVAEYATARDYVGTLRSCIPDAGAYEGGGANYEEPNKATTPGPGHGETHVEVTTTLTWAAGEGDYTSHTLYFGTDSTPDETESLGTQASGYDPTGDLAHSTTYYWRVDTVNGTETTTGDVWSFTTKAETPTPGGTKYLIGRKS